MHIHDVYVYRLLVAIVTISRAGLQRVFELHGLCGIPCCGLPVIVRSLRLVVLVLGNWLELGGGMFLFAVGCSSVRDCYD